MLESSKHQKNQNPLISLSWPRAPNGGAQHISKAPNLELVINPNFSISTNWANQAIYTKSITSIINLTSNSSLNTMKQLKIKSRSFKSGSTTLEQQLGFINLKRVFITTIVKHFIHYTCSSLSSNFSIIKTQEIKKGMT